MSDTTQEEAHTGPIKTPGQLLLAVFFSFIIPIVVVIGLVYYVVSENKPAGATQAESFALGGITVEDRDKGVMARIQKIGMVEIRDANRPLKTGEEVFKAQCTTCHTAGLLGAPKFGDAAAWAPRIATGFEALLHSALAGKGSMAAQGGGDYEDTEIARAVVYMANAGGAKFDPPKAPAAAASDASGSTPMAAAAPASAAVKP
jgi:cytochrome c5